MTSNTSWKDTWWWWVNRWSYAVNSCICWKIMGFFLTYHQNNRYLSSEKRESMSQTLGLTENQVKAWFQNRRWADRFTTYFTSNFFWTIACFLNMKFFAIRKWSLISQELYCSATTCWNSNLRIQRKNKCITCQPLLNLLHFYNV